MLEKLLGSRVRARILGWLFAHHDRRYFVRELEGLLGEDATNISRELARLAEMGVLVSEKEGRQKHYQANPECAIFEELRGLALKTAGMADIVRDALSPLAGEIAAAFIYGSQANGTATSASDVDLFVAGDVDEAGLHTAVAQAEERLQRSVNYTLMDEREFQRRKEERGTFLSRVLSVPKIPILGDNA